MFNVIVSGADWEGGRFEILGNRVFEHTDAEIEQRLRRDGVPDFQAMRALPTLFMNEGTNGELARLGTVVAVAPMNRGRLRIDCILDQRVPAFQNRQLFELRNDLQLEDFEFSRNHWAVKDGDLCRTLLQAQVTSRIGPKVFRIPEQENVEGDLVSVMMPFDAAFDPVFQHIQALTRDMSLRCERADTIWDNDVVMDDVVSLIDRSKVVVADCTGRNANVFYEVGIAHTLGRDVVLITPNGRDVPFDLQHRRYLQYLNNAEGLEGLARGLRGRLDQLLR